MNLRPMELRDTIDMMQSDDYKERFKAEYYQVGIRYEKLKTMLERWDGGELQFKPTCPRMIYSLQLANMKGYLDVLKVREEAENIKL